MSAPAVETSPGWRPKRWIAVILAIPTAPLAFLYLRKPRHALLFAIASLAFAVLDFVASGQARVGASVAEILLWVAGLYMTYRFARNAAAGYRPWYARWYGLIGILVSVVAVVGVVRVFFYEPFLIPSKAMQPALEQGSRILVQKWGYGHLSTVGLNFGRLTPTTQMQRGDIVVFDYPVDPSQAYIKRLVGLPGDRIVYRDKHLLVNGQDTYLRQEDDYLEPETLQYRQRHAQRLGSVNFDVLIDPNVPIMQDTPRNFPFRGNCVYSPEEFRCTVPAGHYFVMGDNRDNTMDSRYWGFVPAGNVIGTVVKVFR